jgi:rubrerythrin
MSDPSTIDEILDYAIGQEQAAVDLYTRMADMTRHEHVKRLFLSFAEEERGHKAKLERVKAGKREILARQHVQDLKLAEYLNDVTLDENPTYQDVLIFAMKQEKQAFRLYNDLAARADTEELRELFLALAQEEAKHKLRFEVEYDEHVLTEN